MNLPGFKGLHISPGKLFIVDAAGALVSAFMLGFVLVTYQNLFGIPAPTLYVLAALPCLFALFDGIAYWTKSSRTSAKLKMIAMLNTGYCGLSLGLASYHTATITALGWVYLLLEIIIVLCLARLEWTTAKRIANNHWK